MRIRRLVRRRKKVCGDSLHGNGQWGFCGLRGRSSFLSTAAFEDPAGKSRLHFGFDPFLNHFAEFNAQIRNFVHFAKPKILQAGL